MGCCMGMAELAGFVVGCWWGRVSPGGRRWIEIPFGEERELWYTYVGQYANKSTVRACGFIYPLKEWRWRSLFVGDKEGRVIIKQPMQQGGVNLPFYVAFIVVPDDGENFVEKFKAQCGEFIRQFSAEMKF